MYLWYLSLLKMPTSFIYKLINKLFEGPSLLKPLRNTHMMIKVLKNAL